MILVSFHFVHIFFRWQLDDLDPVDQVDGSAEKKSKQTDELITDRPIVQVEKIEEQSDSDETTNVENSDTDDDNDPPSCERQQFAQYVMTCISELPEKNAAQAIATIKLFLQKWPGFVGDE